MFEEHPSFTSPPIDTTIWRYMDIAKYLSILDKQALYFCSFDSFKDPYEGAYPARDVEMLKKHIVPDKDEETTKRRVKTHLTGFRETALVNCWQIDEYESTAMWETYARNNLGIAIRSTYKRLRDCFDKYPMPVYIGVVKYIDYEKDSINHVNCFDPLLHKSKHYAWENELRVIVVNELVDLYEPRPNLDIVDGGEYVNVNLDILIESIYLHPNSPQWFINLISSVTNKYGLNKEIRPSKILSGPQYIKELTS
mgnify:CR=1 FL=1